MALLGLGRFFSFLIFYTVGRTPWTGDQPVARPLPAHRTTQTQNKRTQTSMHRVGFEPTIPVFERAKIVHALDRATTVLDTIQYKYRQCPKITILIQFIHLLLLPHSYVHVIPLSPSSLVTEEIWAHVGINLHLPCDLAHCSCSLLPGNV
jgi:hypothetical protein